ncbi:DUF771 domain-containing protein [Virgibacillus salexigens]|uniref:DUF771 domain-containing protein n=1 Tax=Virgibacillus salexigens TaxID=61016 RepID=UPI00190994A8|nr:DUF771 domain-containing protein [Virgibacillus salexigens]
MQQLNVQLNVPVPSDKVLISKVELDELKQESLSGVFWSMKDLEQRTSKKQEWLKENILYRSKFRSELEKFVYYPKSKGQSWSFQAKRMAQFLERNFDQIFY